MARRQAAAGRQGARNQVTAPRFFLVAPEGVPAQLLVSCIKAACEAGDVASLLGWDDATYAALRPYLIQHVESCPLRRDDVIAAYPEQSLTAWDTDVDVVMSTRTDLVIETGSGYIIRETKSVGSHHALPETAAEIFERYPQVAVTLCMLADGLDPVSGQLMSEQRPSRVDPAAGFTRGPWLRRLRCRCRRDRQGVDCRRDRHDSLLTG